MSFSGVTSSAGLVEPLRGMYGHAVAFGDVDADGWQDLFVGTFADYPDSNYLVRGATGPSPDRLLRGWSQRLHRRRDVPDDVRVNERSHLRRPRQRRRPRSGDHTRHVRTDRVRGDAPNVVLRNDGGRFVAGPALAPSRQGRGIGVLDYDGDGLLDLFIADDPYDGGESVTFRNQGGLQFQDVTAAAGLAGVQGFGVESSDLNGDGWPDLVVAANSPVSTVASSPTARLFLNNRSGSFRQIDNSAFTAPTSTTRASRPGSPSRTSTGMADPTS